MNIACSLLAKRHFSRIDFEHVEALHRKFGRLALCFSRNKCGVDWFESDSFFVPIPLSLSLFFDDFSFEMTLPVAGPIS